ncbi:MAG: tRNA (guanosine(46)-N7)-methyltransferase TrmB [Ignavibacteriaceae bacterium]|jgi:tRNA (guanine-N7-)-methyltransferase|nr:tRNA (guanosine(46)-N7)-methyltransferase TrmB [Ignavibacteriaceae bacterium]
MARTKLKKLSKVKDLPNVFDLETESVQNEIHDYFKPDRLFTLEIGCGHGDYSIELAKRFPERVFIGIDVKGARVYLGATKAIEEKLDNVAFIVGRAEKLNEAFKFKSVEEIYIPFPDPHVRRSNQNRRLISNPFLKIYKELLTDSGVIHFKTDNQSLYDHALKVISEFGCKILYLSENLYGNENKLKSSIITNFERHYIKEGRKIKYIRFKF